MQNNNPSYPTLSRARNTIRLHNITPEEKSVEHLLSINPLSEKDRKNTEVSALDFVEQCRANPGKQGVFDSFLQEYSLSSQEGVVLMCLAEALLRVPDSFTIDRLIAEKVHLGEWGKHIGKSNELLVNAASAGLLLTRKILNKEQTEEDNPKTWFRRLINRLGEPVVRHATLQAMKFMGQQYVLGRSIEEASKRGKRENIAGTRFSFDMLGEGARTYEDADKYYAAYMHAIQSIGKSNCHTDVRLSDGISVKLSALHPRYEFSHHQLVLDELLPSILSLAKEAKRYNVGLTLDAEEAARLDIELDIFHELAFSPELKGWQGLGFVLQAYQKRALYVVDWLVDLAKLSERTLMVRLVKGAYWDAEIKHAQEMGYNEFPVFTRKVNTDLSYQVCAAKLLESRDVIYPQFATHNAYTVSLILQMVGADKNSFEFQRLHGMGELLYSQVSESTGTQLPLRVYAPVGVHKDLLPYLVRRLLENGANGSFVNQFLDGKVPAAHLVRSVESTIQNLNGNRNTQIPLANELFVAYGENRNNSKGLDLDDPISYEKLQKKVDSFFSKTQEVGPIINGDMRVDDAFPIYSPADSSLVVGYCAEANRQEVQTALESAAKAQASWQSKSVNVRAAVLDSAADLLEQNTEELTTLISFEAGRTLGDGISEVREAVDFCRYYALQARLLSEQYPNHSGLSQGKGVFVCISPWNFPLAIFVGQIVSALVTGNAVIAKPAEQTPIVAVNAVNILHKAGVPKEVLQLLTGTGASIGPQLLASPYVSGVAFTGSTETAQRIQSDLVKRGLETACKMPPFIAETGGQNVMIVDSTALPEQVVDSVIQSAFLSAGQRCSALRVLYLQEDIAQSVISMLKGAVAALKMGYPWQLSSDIGPVIDEKSVNTLAAHKARMLVEGILVTEGKVNKDCEKGHFVQPQIYELEHINQLKREVFGPVLHIIRYKANQLHSIIKDVNDTGYGLTLGVHSRIKEFADDVFNRTKVGNTYINRNIVGAVVGVNPFGGHGLSGTGFKAGGPHYLLRFTNLWESVPIVARVAKAVSGLSVHSVQRLSDSKYAYTEWEKERVSDRCELLTKAIDEQSSALLSQESKAHCYNLVKQANKAFSKTITLPGPTGETNELTLHARGVALICIDKDSLLDGSSFIQMIGALAAGNSVVLIGIVDAVNNELQNLIQSLAEALPKGLVSFAHSEEDLEPLLLNDDIALVACVNPIGLVPVLAKRKGAIIPVINHINGEFALMPYAVEKTKTNNIVATGGNAMLLNLQEE